MELTTKELSNLIQFGGYKVFYLDYEVNPVDDIINVILKDATIPIELKDKFINKFGDPEKTSIVNKYEEILKFIKENGNNNKR